MAPLHTPEAERAAAERARQEELAGQALLARFKAHLQAAGIPATHVLRRGDAATEIIEHARSTHVDLIVAGSRGLSPMKAWLLGSVSRKLVHYAGCSVLVVKEPLTHESV